MLFWNILFSLYCFIFNYIILIHIILIILFWKNLLVFAPTIFFWNISLVFVPNILFWCILFSLYYFYFNYIILNYFISFYSNCIRSYFHHIILKFFVYLIGFVWVILSQHILFHWIFWLYCLFFISTILSFFYSNYIILKYLIHFIVFYSNRIALKYFTLLGFVRIIWNMIFIQLVLF